MKSPKRWAGIVLTLLAAHAWADGTVSFQSDVLPLLKTRPAFQAFMLEAFTVNDAGTGTRISDQAIPHLGGARIGPYKFNAIWHSPSGDKPVTLVIDTDTKFFNRAGREITDGRLRRAVELKEAFSAIEIEAAR